ncbi:MAG: hypothetical protein IJ000_02815 [Paludibacteraceae bacterium]|nr:hypothetical protein [Paludibacteraceae bacterium]
MKTTKCFALAIAALALIVGMTSCEPRTQYDPTTDEKNILLDLPSFVKSVEGQTLDQIKKTLSDRGYKYEGVVDGSEFFTINAKNISMDSLAADGADMTEFVTSNTSLLQLLVKDNGGFHKADNLEFVLSLYRYVITSFCRCWYKSAEDTPNL